MALATEKRRGRGVDPRLLVGILLVAASVAGVVGLVAALDRRVTVYAASGTLVPGDVVDSAALVERRVILDGAEAQYLAPGDLDGEAFVAVEPVRQGELVAVGAVAGATELETGALVIRLASPASASLEAGDRVDLWASEPSAPGIGETESSAQPPTVLAAEAIVVRIAADSGLVQSDEATTAELLLPRATIAGVLQAVADDAALVILPAGSPGETVG